MDACRERRRESPGQAPSFVVTQLARIASDAALRSAVGQVHDEAVAVLRQVQEVDDLLGRLAVRDDIIAISLSVDYWDYLGWKDTLAQPKFSYRQKAYAKVLGDGMVYTPQMVVNGRAHVNGSDAVKIERAIDRTANAFVASRVPVRMSVADGRLLVEVGGEPQSVARESTVWLAVLSKTVEVPITRGENKGKTLIYTNVVRDLIPIGMWHGEPFAVQIERDSFMHGHADRCAVLLQQGRGGPIVGAALLSQF